MSNVRKILHGDLVIQTGSLLRLEDGAEFSGSLIPIQGGKGSVGSSQKPFKDAFLSSGSLHIDGRRAVYFDETEGRLVLGGPNNEDVMINASGSGVVIITNELKLPSGSVTASAMVTDQIVSPSGGSITGSLFGTASFAENTPPSEQAQTASIALAAPMFVSFFDAFIGKFQVSLLSSVGELPIPGDSSDDKTTVRTKLDLTGYREARLVIRVTNTGGSTQGWLGAQYSLDQSTWASLNASGGPTASVASVSINTAGFVPLVSESKTDVYVRLVGQDPGGNAPEFGHISLQVR